MIMGRIRYNIDVSVGAAKPWLEGIQVSSKYFHHQHPEQEFLHDGKYLIIPGKDRLKRRPDLGSLLVDPLWQRWAQYSAHQRDIVHVGQKHSNEGVGYDEQNRERKEQQISNKSVPSSE